MNNPFRTGRGMVPAVLVLAAVACGDAAPEPETIPEENPSSSEPARTVIPGTSVLNPNITSADQMSALPGMDAEVAAGIVEGRPYLSPVALNQALSEHLDASEVAAVLERLFVPIDLNTATREEILLVPGVGERMAHEFEEYRPYEAMARFRREIAKYVDDEEVERLAQYVFVPADLNTATEEQFLAIPGVGDRLLHEFMEYRPYESMEQFRREIGKYVDDDELERLARYVTLGRG